MFVVLAVTAFLGLLGCIAVAKVTHLALDRLGLDAWAVMQWFGITEDPHDELAARRREPGLRSERIAVSGQ